MSDALKRIKADLADPNNMRGMGGKVIVDTRVLCELVKHYERMESAERALHNAKGGADVKQVLQESIEAVYRQQGRDSELTLMIIMDTLIPLMEERHKEKEIKGYWR